MTDRILFTLALLAIALMGTVAMVAMEIAQVPIDRGFATVLVGFLGTIAAVFIGLLKSMQNASAIQELPTKQDVKQAASEAVETAKAETASELAEARRNQPGRRQSDRQNEGQGW